MSTLHSPYIQMQFSVPRIPLLGDGFIPQQRIQAAYSKRQQLDKQSSLILIKQTHKVRVYFNIMSILEIEPSLPPKLKIEMTLKYSISKNIGLIIILGLVPDSSKFNQHIQPCTRLR